jgi:hypothetical protein
MLRHVRLTAVAGLVVIAGLSDGSREAVGGGIPAPVLPRIAALRIAAECGGAFTFMPRSLPRSFALSRWTTVAGDNPCGGGPVVRFHRGAAAVTWRSRDSSWGGWPRCRDRRAIASAIDGRTVLFRRTGQGITAWACVRSTVRDVPLTISAGEARRPQPVTPRELERMVADARPLPAGRAASSRFDLPSAPETRRMATAFGLRSFLPRRLPLGFVFTAWAVTKGNRYDRRRALSLTFGRDGLTLGWTVSSGADTADSDCTTSHAPQNRRIAAMRVIRHRHVFFAAGIQGANVWRCIPARAVGSVQPLEVDLWYDIDLDSHTMRQQAMRLVAAAKLVHPGR